MGGAAGMGSGGAMGGADAMGGAGVMDGAGGGGTGGMTGDAAGPGNSDGSSGTSGAAGMGGTAGTGGNGSGGQGGASDSGAPGVRACPAGQFLTGIDSRGRFSCADLDTLTRATINDSCSVYSGWRDVCEGCADPPEKWGRVNGTSCQNGSGADNSCLKADLGGIGVHLFGLNADGTVDQNDKFFTSLHCAAPSGIDEEAAETCPPGQFVAGLSEQGLTCTSGQRAVLAYARQHCSIYFGWRDECGGCTTAPARWGRANDDSCDVGIGAANSCSSLALGTENVNLFGMNTGGKVDDNDKFYVAFHCAGAAGDAGPVGNACPPGQLVTGINPDATLQCASASAAIERYARQHCFVYSGWRDSCGGCTSAPTKWGRVNDTVCANGAGINNTCTDGMLGTEPVRLFGLNTAGTVGNDDKFYAGFRCE